MFGKLPIGLAIASISVPVVMIGERMKTFHFTGSIPLSPLVDPDLPAGGKISDLGIPNTVDLTVDGVPTVFGSATPKMVTTADLLAGLAAGPRGILSSRLNAGDSFPLPFVGVIDWGFMPMFNATEITVGVKIPVINNIQVGVRYLPTIGVPLMPDLGSFGFSGGKVQYEFSHLIPVFKHLPLIHTSVYGAYNSLNLEIGSLAKASMTNWISMLNVSVDPKLAVGVGVFAGVGLEGSAMDLEVTAGQNSPAFTISMDGANALRAQGGVRFSFGCFDIWADANYGSVVSFNAGITLVALNGL